MKIVSIISMGIVAVLLISVTMVLLMDDPASEPGQSFTAPDVIDQVPEAVGTEAVSGPMMTEPVTDVCEDTPEVSALTTIKVSKEATGFWMKEIVYDWSVEKSILASAGVIVEDSRQASAQVAQGRSVSVQYEIVAERSVVDESEVMGVRGSVTVTNTGPWPTDGLEIVDTIYECDDCDCRCLAEFTINTSAHPVLCPGESYSYAYVFEFEAIAGAEYRNIARASISNNVIDGVVCASDLFGIPSVPAVEEIDECAQLIEDLEVPDGFQGTMDAQGPWMLDGDTTMVVTVDVSADPMCSSSKTMNNAVRLNELDTCQQRCDNASVELTVINDDAPEDDQGCGDQDPCHDGRGDHDRDGGCGHHHHQGGHHQRCGDCEDHHHQSSHRDGQCGGHSLGHNKAPGHCH
jgi:hypothetical protein